MLDLNVINIEEGTKSDNIILWGVKVSPYVRKVMIALEEKNITYKQIEVLPKSLLIARNQPIPNEFELSSPLGKIPAIKIGNFSLADSAVIAGFLDKNFDTGNRLYPKDAEEYGRALWFEHYSDRELTNVIYNKIFVEAIIKPLVLNQQKNDVLLNKTFKEDLPPILNYLERSVALYEWISGDQFSMADIAIFTQLMALEMAGYDFHSANLTKLNQYIENCKSRPSIKKIILN